MLGGSIHATSIGGCTWQNGRTASVDYSRRYLFIMTVSDFFLHQAVCAQNAVHGHVGGEGRIIRWP